MKKIRIGIVGLGIGQHHANGYLTHPSAEIVALCDMNPDRLKTVADNLNVANRYTDYKEMLAKEKLDVLSVCTPNSVHKEVTIAGFKAGCHVLCEKPMAMSADEAREMLAASKKAKKRLMIDFSYRFSEQSQALKAQVETGILGDIYFARTIWLRRRGIPGMGGWFTSKELAGGGPLIDLGVHRLDLALWLMGYPKPKWVLAGAYNHIASKLAKSSGKEYTVEDMAVGMIRFENGATLEVEASWASNIKENELMETRLLGTEGGLVQRNRNQGYDFEAELFIERAGCQFDMTLHPPVPGSHGAMYTFLEAIKTDTPHPATGEEGLIVMEILDALYKSAETGEPVKI
ncbi:MAG: Gfo/Idh/MocA family protein [Armatimonadota bacterium]